MFTSRSEYRLSLRADNADLRLTPLLLRACPGAVSPQRAAHLAAVQRDLDEGLERLRRTSMTSRAWAQLGFSAAAGDVRQVSALDMMQRPHASIDALVPHVPGLDALPRRTLERLGIQAAYVYLLERQSHEIDAFQRDEARVLPALDYRSMPGISAEMQERLMAVRPRTLGEAKRIVGCTPACYAILWRHSIPA